MKLSRKAVIEGLNQVPIDTVLLGVTGAQESKLTAKQREFARQLALGETKAGAYRKAYKSKGNPKTVHTRGAELSSDSRIQAQAEAYKRAVEAQRLATPAHLRALVVQQLTEKAIDPEVPVAQQIRALELLGKIGEVSLFVNRTEITHVKSSEEVREKLLESIRAAIKNGAEDAEVKDADSLLSEIRESNLVSDKVTDGSHLSSDNVTSPIQVTLAGDNVTDSHFVSDKVTDDDSPDQSMANGQPGESHFSSDKVTMWRESNPGEDASEPGDMAAGADVGADSVADEAGAGACDLAGRATPPEGHPPRGV